MSTMEPPLLDVLPQRVKVAPQALPALEGRALADVIEWDVRNWSRALRFWKRHSSLDISRCRALEIGSRGGGLSLWLALQGAHVVCSDVKGPNERAVEKHARYGVSRLITYECIDARDIPYANQFDLVVFKSVLGALGSREDQGQTRAIAQMHKALKPGGELFFAENLAGSWLHVMLRRHLVSWGRRWQYVGPDEVTELMAPFADVTWAATGFLGTLGRSERQRSALALMDELLFNALVPSRWRYIGVGVARKAGVAHPGHRDASS